MHALSATALPRVQSARVRRGRQQRSSSIGVSASYNSQQPQGSWRRPLEERLLDPVEAIALPGRVALGTILRLPEALANPSAVQERLQGLLSDSRPVQDIGASLASEVQSAVLEAADRGTEAEAQLRAALPTPLVGLLPPLPTTPGGGFDASTAQIDVTPGATFSPGPPRVMPAEGFSGGQAANRLGSELSRLSAEVEAVREAVVEYAGSGVSSMMAVSIKEQRDRLQAHLREIDAAAASLGVEGRDDLQWAEAIEEVRLLAAELDALGL